MSDAALAGFDGSDDEEDEDYIPGIEDDVEEEYAEEDLSDDPDKLDQGSRYLCQSTLLVPSQKLASLHRLFPFLEYTVLVSV